LSISFRPTENKIRTTDIANGPADGTMVGKLTPGPAALPKVVRLKPFYRFPFETRCQVHLGGAVCVRAVKKHSGKVCNLMEIIMLRLKSVFSRQGSVLKKHSRRLPQHSLHGGVWGV
jgi:hypothetical protein